MLQSRSPCYGMGGRRNSADDPLLPSRSQSLTKVTFPVLETRLRSIGFSAYRIRTYPKRTSLVAVFGLGGLQIDGAWIVEPVLYEAGSVRAIVFVRDLALVVGMRSTDSSVWLRCGVLHGAMD